MYIQELRAKNFRNYNDIKLGFSSGINFISGSNAAGKTNLLEAISIASNVKSFRNVPDTEIIQWGKDYYFCSVRTGENSNSSFEIGCSVDSGKIKKKARIDGVEKRRLSDYYGRFLTVIFSPEDINIINGSPEVRRRFFDGIISKVDAEYLSVLSDFKRILLSRNRLLKDLSEKKRHTAAELDVWDKMFSDKSAFLINRREAFLKKYREFFREAYLGISPVDGPPELGYSSSFETGSCEEILLKLRECRKRDIRRGAAGTGPHRDDYTFSNETGISFKNYASQGQKRSVAISLRIAEARVVEKVTQEKPVILIDDIFSELDENRRNNLIEKAIEKNQTIITSVNAEFLRLESFNDIARFIVEPGGRVREI